MIPAKVMWLVFLTRVHTFSDLGSNRRALALTGWLGPWKRWSPRQNLHYDGSFDGGRLPTQRAKAGDPGSTSRTPVVVEQERESTEGGGRGRGRVMSGQSVRGRFLATLPSSIILKQPSRNPATLDFDVRNCTTIVVNFPDEPTYAENKIRLGRWAKIYGQSAYNTPMLELTRNIPEITA